MTIDSMIIEVTHIQIVQILRCYTFLFSFAENQINIAIKDIS